MVERDENAEMEGKACNRVRAGYNCGQESCSWLDLSCSYTIRPNPASTSDKVTEDCPSSIMFREPTVACAVSFTSLRLARCAI